MKRLAACFALLMVMSWSLAADAGAKKKAPGDVQAAAADLVGVDLVSPAGSTGTPYLSFQANVLGADTASACILAPALPCKLVSYVDFWVDLPANLISHPDPSKGCPSRATTCQYMGRDYESAYGLGLRYDGPAGLHSATAVAWRSVWGDTQPVFLGQGSDVFNLVP
jgi:hypothetical protein